MTLRILVRLCVVLVGAAWLLAGCSVVDRAEMRQEIARSSAYIEQNCPGGSESAECRDRLERMERLRLEALAAQQAQRRQAMIAYGMRSMQPPPMIQPAPIVMQPRPVTTHCNRFGDQINSTTY